MATIPPVTDPRFDPKYNEPPEPKKRSVWATCLIGCLVVLIVMLVLVSLVLYWGAQRWRNWVADGGSLVAKQMIDNSALPAEEKLDINAQVDRLATAFRQNRISMEQWTELTENLAQSPLMTSFMASAIEQVYFAKSGLSAEEKAAGKITLQRFLRGIVDEKINEQGIDAAMVHVATRKSNGEWQIRQNVTDAELRAFLDAAKTAADKAGIESTPPDFDPSEEFKRIIDEAMNQSGGLEPPQIELPELEFNPPETSPLPEVGK